MTLLRQVAKTHGYTSSFILGKNLNLGEKTQLLSPLPSCEGLFSQSFGVTLFSQV